MFTHGAMQTERGASRSGSPRWGQSWAQTWLSWLPATVSSVQRSRRWPLALQSSRSVRLWTQTRFEEWGP